MLLLSTLFDILKRGYQLFHVNVIQKLFSCEKSRVKKSHYVDYNKFLMFGDSITEFSFDQFPNSSNKIHFSLGAAIQNAYVRKLQVLQRGFSGYTSREAVPLIKSILKHEHDEVTDSQKIKLAYVFFGTNDARLKGTGVNNQHVPIDTYVANMKLIVQEFKKRNIPLVVITPGLHDQKLWDKTHPEDLITGDYRSNKVNKEYQDALKYSIHDTPILCLYDEMRDWLSKHSNFEADELLCDGIHFTGTGYKIVFDALLQIINENFPEVSPQNMEYRFPLHATLDEHTFDHID
ncbi:hypothetical protein CANINC_003054 [Pichia inconspicua]|uniref:Uncharacterized protein n=1 Tax=Pichia inconspicua TaxID=52247 RepID=A0A4V4NFJ7_9ASCO|nr:hypothetical protein CANINC_003054 [[Candida] inconspicua]